MTIEVLWDYPEVSQYTGIPVATLRWWRANGLGPKSARLGRRVKFRKSDVEAWISAAFEGNA